MLRNVLAAALRHLARNRLYAAIGVFGLAVGLWVALIAGVVIRNQYSFDHIVADHQQVYLAATRSGAAGRAESMVKEIQSRIGPRLLQQFGEIRAVARMQLVSVPVQHGATEAHQDLWWADPDTFVVLPMPVLAGDPVAALRLPDSLVMTASIARKYFGDDPAIGRTLLVNGEPMMLRAIISDPPANETQFQAGAFASAVAAFSPLAQQDADPKNDLDSDFFMVSSRTFLRLAPGTDVEALQARIDTYVAGFWKARSGSPSLELVRLDRINTHPGLNPGITDRLVMLAVLGAVTLLIAAINFANLLAARAGRRATEVGIRRVAGASRGAIVLQFLAESLGYVLVSVLLAVALLEWSLPHANAFLDAGARFEYWNDPRLSGMLLAGTLALSLLAGGGSALVLAGVRPLDALTGRRRHSRLATWLRNGLVTLQFALLVTLIICSGVISSQRSFATGEALRLDTDQMLALVTPCQPALLDGLRVLPGVSGLSCTGFEFLTFQSSVYGDFRGADGEPHDLSVVPLDGATLKLYGITPLAGGESFGQGEPDGRILINESALRELGYASMHAAIGQPGGANVGSRGTSYAAREISGVVRDFSLLPVTQQIPPTAYIHAPAEYGAVHLRLAGRQIPETLAAIDTVWRRMGYRGEPFRFFIDDNIQALYLAMLRQAQAFGVISLVAGLLACLGLLGLAASVAEQRTKEIGIRKALGAQTGDVMRLLLWQFSRPVVWANLLAWPFAGWAMQRWLNGFAYHVDLPLWLFPAAALATVLIALATVSAHTLGVARAKPVMALRHE